MLGTVRSNVLAQHDEQCGGKRDETVATALALLDVDQHASAVDVADAKVRDFGRAQPRGVGRHHDCAVLAVSDARKQP